MKRFLVGGIVLASSFLGLGCNQKGTCIKGEGRWANCIVNATEEICNKGQFFKEAPTAGALHCKTEGFTRSSVGVGAALSSEHRRVEEGLASGELVYYKKPDQ